MSLCPRSRGGCGNTLRWEEGAFCQRCIREALEAMKKEPPETPLDRYVALAGESAEALRDAWAALSTDDKMAFKRAIFYRKGQ